MTDTKLDIEKIVRHWIESSDDDFKTMQFLLNAKSYNWALFLGHISTEKLLKAFFVKKFNKHAPLTHNLYRLAELCEIKLTDEYSDWLDKITTFNINARYDDYKKSFYLLCTPEFTNEWVEKIKIFRSWIKEMF